MPHAGLNFETPNAAWDPLKQDHTITRARKFGCEVWFLRNNSQTLPKGVPRHRKGVFLGFSPDAAGYRIMDLGTRKVITSRDVYFNEDKFPYCGPPADRQSTVVEESNEVMVLVPAPPSSAADADAGGAAPDGHQDAVDGVVEGGDYDDPPTPVSPEPAESSDEEVPVTPPPGGSRRSARTRQLSEQGIRSLANTPHGKRKPADGDIVELPEELPENPSEQSEQALRALAGEEASILLSDDFRKMTQRQIRQTTLAPHFKKAEGREIDSLLLHRTWTVVKLKDIPRNRRPITCRWVYDVKRDGDNNITVFKARLTAHGFKQQEGLDYKETFAAVAQMKSFRATVALSRLLGLTITQIDISNAFLHGELEEEIYMTHPPGYEDTAEPGTCLRLNKGRPVWSQASWANLEHSVYHCPKGNGLPTTCI